MANLVDKLYYFAHYHLEFKKYYCSLSHANQFEIQVLKKVTLNSLKP